MIQFKILIFRVVNRAKLRNVTFSNEFLALIDQIVYSWDKLDKIKLGYSIRGLKYDSFLGLNLEKNGFNSKIDDLFISFLKNALLELLYPYYEILQLTLLFY